MVVGPILGYFDQARLIIQSKSSAGFNAKTCAILLFANILRIFFWLGKRFDVTLLLQSIVMIVAQLVLLYIVFRYRQCGVYTNLGDVSPSSMSLDEQLEAELQQQDGLPPQLLSDDSDGSHGARAPLPARALRWCKQFWAWDSYLDYLNCLLIFTTVLALLYLLLNRVSAFIEILGIISLGIESTLPIPQCIANFKRKSTKGFSLLVLATWSPAQFVICGSIQLSIDTLIVGQFILYSPYIQGYRKPYEQQERPTSQCSSTSKQDERTTYGDRASLFVQNLSNCLKRV
ncbi:hypothetical protein BC940DRAFT_317395 [Gongronella butleri]|nr:hypothetical protein BC940DRAFT_317395 [Gongronella butleri]